MSPRDPRALEKLPTMERRPWFPATLAVPLIVVLPNVMANDTVAAFTVPWMVSIPTGDPTIPENDPVARFSCRISRVSVTDVPAKTSLAFHVPRMSCGRAGAWDGDAAAGGDEWNGQVRVAPRTPATSAMRLTAIPTTATRGARPWGSLVCPRPGSASPVTGSGSSASCSSGWNVQRASAGATTTRPESLNQTSLSGSSDEATSPGRGSKLPGRGPLSRTGRAPSAAGTWGSDTSKASAPGSLALTGPAGRPW